MADFDLITWRKLPLDGDLARSIRKDVRTHRRERGRGGHRFSFSHLKSLYGSDSGLHAVCNHTDDSVWQFWYRHPEDGWVLVNWHDALREAKAAAELPMPDTGPKPRPLAPGIHLLAGWDHGEETEYTIRLCCSSEDTATAMTEVYQKLGCLVKREVV
jgi:hypothetical protein